MLLSANAQHNTLECNTNEWKERIVALLFDLGGGKLNFQFNIYMNQGNSVLSCYLFTLYNLSSRCCNYKWEIAIGELYLLKRYMYCNAVYKYNLFNPINYFREIIQSVNKAYLYRFRGIRIMIYVHFQENILIQLHEIIVS